MKYVFIAATILFAALGQLSLKIGVPTLKYPQGSSLFDFVRVFFANFFNVYLLLSIFFAFCSAGFWVLVVQKIPLNKAYPFMSLNYVVVYFLSWIFFQETISALSILGLGFIFFGLYLLQG
jgi:undecaprenyl phosphate-alpha-L-ara4N flippase subunit ArnF